MLSRLVGRFSNLSPSCESVMTVLRFVRKTEWVMSAIACEYYVLFVTSFDRGTCYESYVARSVAGSRNDED